MLVIAAAAAGYLAFGRRSSHPVSPLISAGSNLLLITIDTLRADHLPAYGYDGVATPAISRLAREGIVFRNAFTPVPLTLPAHSSLLTGLLPFSHGVRDNGGFYLDSSAHTLAEGFSAQGYRTAAFVSAFVLDSRWGVAQGFDQYADGFNVALMDLAAMARVQRPAGPTWEAAEKWLAGHASEPFFLWLHFFDPHAPYAPPEPFKTTYAARPYDGEIAYVDSVLASIVAELEARTLLEETVILVVSDHGEGLGDHGEDEHGLLTYDSTLRVPWIMRLPNGLNAGTTIDRAVSLVDVFPTVLEMFGFAGPARLDGVSQLAALRAPAAGTGEILYAESFYPSLRFGWSALVSVRTDRFKYIRAPRRELFDYRQDPQESTNVIDRHREIADRLDRALTTMIRSVPAEQRRSAPVDPESERKLRALGYVGGSPPVGLSTAGVDLPDPRDKVGAYQQLTRARQLLEEGSVAEGVERLERLLDAEPDLEPAHRTLREYWIRRGEFERADAKYRAEINRRPGEVQWLMDLGLTYQAWRRDNDARNAFNKVLAARPDHSGALKGIAEIAEAQGAHEDALAYYARALKGSPDSEELIVRLAQTYFRLGRLQDAAAILNRAIVDRPRISGAHYLLAQIAEQLGDTTGAEREYRLEIATSPWDHRARFNLAIALGRRGAIAEEIALLESILPLAPAFHEVHFYLAKAYLDTRDPAKLGDALAAATRGLRLAPLSTSAPLGHYVMADVYMLQGKHAEAEQERRRGQALEQHLAASGKP